MSKQLLRRLLFGALILAVAIPGGSIYRRYQQDMVLAYQRIASGGKLIETACGPMTGIWRRPAPVDGAWRRRRL